MNAVASGPYGQLLTQFVRQEFPTKLQSGAELVDVLTAEILGTKQTRLGPKPTAESQVAIRDVLRKYTASGDPIPFMVPWGSEKPDGGSIDIAELSALRTMQCLADRIGAHYLPGAVMNVRLEDASAPFLLGDAAWAVAQRYTSDFAALVSVLGTKAVRVRPESLKVSVNVFNHEAELARADMSCYLKAVVNQQTPRAHGLLQQLETRGWRGAIDIRTIQFYLAQYEKARPGEQVAVQLETLGRYFASALARKRLGIRGDEPEWAGSFIDLAFTAPTPGVDSTFPRRVHYRTMPLDFTSLHIAPWRAKGYLKIDNENELTPKLASFNDRETLSALTSQVVTLSNETLSVDVRADYMLT